MQSFTHYASWKARRKPGDQAESYRFFRFEVNSLKVLDEKAFGDGVFVSAAVR